MQHWISLTQAVTFLAWGQPREADDLRAEASETIKTRERGWREDVLNQSTLFGGMLILDESGDLILHEARCSRLKIWGRRGAKQTLWENTPALELLTDIDLHEAVAVNLLNNCFVHDERASSADQTAAHRVKFHDLCVERSEIEALAVKLARQKAPSKSTAERFEGKNTLTELAKWTRERHGNDTPSRKVLLADFRHDFGPVREINDQTMRELRAAVASESQKKGGSRMHARYRT